MATKLSKEERRREKDLLAARQAGNVMPEQDVVTGKSINPHIPEWMAKPAWYQDDHSGPSLKHQKAPTQTQYNADPNKLHHYAKKAIIGKASKFRKGACENCGSMTHKRKDCLERPRKIGAAFSGKDIAADEVLIDSKGESWDEKRDRWAGYDSAAHKRLVIEHEALEEAQRKMREEELDRGVTNDMKSVQKVAKAGKKAKAKDADDFGSSDESGEEDETKYADGADVAGQHVDTKNRVTVRNLRIREDTAKYLRNLDIESSYYDPKSRSMREAPDKSVNPLDTAYAGDNFHRMSGQARDVQALEVFAWQAEQRGSTVNVNTNPTKAALVYKEFLQKKDALKDTSSKSILEKYGGEQYLSRPAKELLEGQSENYVEYDRSTGALVKGLERAKAVSKYAEDVFPGNHTSVWGSYWTDGHWGFACCHSLLKSSYCVGEIGKQAAARASRMLTDGQDDDSAEAETRKRKLGEDDNEEQPPAKRPETTLKAGMRHNRYDQVTEEDMERFQAERKQFEDPLKNLGKDELLPL